MVFTLEQHDSSKYRRKARMISIAMAGQLVIFGMLFSMLLTSTFGNSLWFYALGIVLGLLATSALFAVLRERPWMAEMRYVWQLRQHLSQISGFLPTLRGAVEEDNRAALDIVTFYHAGVAQLATLNGRTPPEDAAWLAETKYLAEKREALGLPARVERFDSQDLQAFKRS